MKAGVFIIESLDFKEEENNIFEGKVLTEVLNMIGVDVFYSYIRTKEELKVMISKFEKSNYKYLHLSCHGDEDGIATTLHDSITFKELSDMFEYETEKSRLFLSSCSVMNGDSILNEMCNVKFLSITGPLTDIDFDDAAIFWASFYHLMFSKNLRAMNTEDMKTVLQKLSVTFEVDISTLIKRKNFKKYKRYDYRYEELKQKTIESSKVLETNHSH